MPVPAAPDAMLVGIDVARALLATRADAYVSGVVVGEKVPSSRSDDAPSVPYVTVRAASPSSADRRGTDERADLRFLVYHRTEAEGYDLARLLHALLLAHEGDARVRAFAPVVGPTPTSDPETGNPLSSFTVEARFRPTTL